MATKFIEEDFVALRRTATSSGKPFLTLAFGDAVEVIPDPQNEHPGFTKVRALTHFDGTEEGFIKGNPPLMDEGILKLSMVDVQQGDGFILETPDGKIVFIDGGENKLFARHAAARFRHKASSDANPLDVEAIIITHGDADHFDGLNDLRRSEELPNRSARKRLFIKPKRVFHNGLVKSPTKINDVSVAEGGRFGRTVEVGDDLFAIELVDDPRDFAEADRSAPFKHWGVSLDHWEQRGPISLKRVAFGMDEDDLFDFLHDEGVTIELQGPFTTMVTDPNTNQQVPGLPYFNKPDKSAVISLEEGPSDGSPSASHTINGHSISFRMTFGNVRFAFTGDQNKDSMERMLEEVGEDNLEAEIVKAPHHGSHEFDFRALKAMKPIVALVSSGDEDTFHEHIHPRATLMAALGKVMRLDIGLIFSTELAAFFHMRDWSHKRDVLNKFFKDHAKDTFTKAEVKKLFTGILDEGDPEAYFGFERINFGIVHIRTDGQRVLVFTHSGKKGMNEAYRFTVDVVNGEHEVEFAEKVVTR
jgi:beta-lactamase superfamily II metal-dependent hydrolase